MDDPCTKKGLLFAKLQCGQIYNVNTLLDDTIKKNTSFNGKNKYR